MKDFKLNSNHDLAIENGDFAFVTEGEEVAQSAKIRFLFVKGEWFLNPLMGIPWFETMFRANYSYNQKAEVLRKAILETDGVNKILSFSFGVDQINKGSLVQFEIETIYGEVKGEVTI